MLHVSLRLVRSSLLAIAVAAGAACDSPTSVPRRQLSPRRPDAPAAPEVFRVDVQYVSDALDTAAWTLPPGATAQAVALAYDSAGAELTGLPTTFSSSDTAVIRVDSTTGSATAVKAGMATISALVGEVTGAGRVLTVVPIESPVPPPDTTTVPTDSAGPPPSPSSVALAVARFDGAAGGPAVVSAGVPLLPGALFPGREDMVRVSAGGAERPAYVAGLASLHPDGSLRAVLVQFRLADLPAGGLAGQLDLGTARDSAYTLAAPIARAGAPPDSVTGVPNGLPQAAALPSDPAYLVATDLVGPTTTRAATAALGGVFARYESNFSAFADRLWSAEGANYLLADYYDRVLIYYAMWARTGDPTYWARAGQIAYDYRSRYLERNAYGTSPHWSQLEGLEKHYLLTGDEASRLAVGRTASRLYSAHINTAYLDRRGGESRIAARVLHAQLLAWRLTPGNTTIANVSQSKFAAQLEKVYDRVVAWQQADGSFPADGQVCGGQLNYMIGLQNDVLIKIYEQYLPASTSRDTLQAQIESIVRKSVDHLWTTQWVPAARAFQYATVACAGIGAPTPAPDVNNLIVTAFGWVYRKTGDASYLAAGDSIFAGGVTQAYLAGTKQFNESYSGSFRYLGYR